MLTPVQRRNRRLHGVPSPVDRYDVSSPDPEARQVFQAAAAIDAGLKRAGLRDCVLEVNAPPGCYIAILQIRRVPTPTGIEEDTRYLGEVDVRGRTLTLLTRDLPLARALFPLQPELEKLGWTVVGHETRSSRSFMFDSQPLLSAEGSNESYWSKPPQTFYAERVLPYLYRSAQPSLSALERLQKYGVGTVISLRQTPVSQDMAEQLGMKFVHIPIADFTAPTLEQIHATLDAIVARKGKAVVSCHAGIGRTGTLISAIELVLGDRPLEALHRACDEVEDKSQVQVLIALARDIEKRPALYARWRQSLSPKPAAGSKARKPL